MTASQQIRVDTAQWSQNSDREALRALRLEVFVREQNVPESLEWDDLDATSLHVLARNQAGEPIGCGRLTPKYKIGRMAVQRDWRGHGVGAALLHKLIDQARSLGWPEVSLDAQVQAMGFYAREGFVAIGEVFDDAGIPHRTMQLTLTPPMPQPDDIQALRVGGRDELLGSRLRLLTQTRQRLMIYQPQLSSDVLASADELAELRRIAISGRGALIRILLHDPAAALRENHRLIALIQRLPSLLQVRTPIEALDLAYPSAYLLNDSDGYLFQPDADRPQGRAACRDRASQAPLRLHFDTIWDRAEHATILQPLAI
ncbi:GNAT family N-acetyltransferase [Dyella silvatica]|uniref:GNAT family N-acetyltransferase n=1 Tax=Dyella silvatica TaxID=2992128 RepID=UPI00224EDFF2|nr:GNAT family N-acetyltransferase [Dyella silvatica]